MGLFSRKKEENSSLPPAPMPPVAQGTQSLNSSPMQVSPQAPFLSAPPIPSRNSLDDIKSQVISSSPSNMNNSNNMNNNGSNSWGSSNNNYNQPQRTAALPVKYDSEPPQPSAADSLDEESLFDFSSLDLDDSSSGSSNIVQVEEPRSFRGESFVDKSESFVDKNKHPVGSISFVSNRSKTGKGGVNDNLFVTTSQFKTFLEIIEQVRLRVKDSSDRHLRLLDIKSEEDVEYENLRKDFQYIEDKLYEVDNLIFDR